MYTLSYIGSVVSNSFRAIVLGFFCKYNFRLLRVTTVYCLPTQVKRSKFQKVSFVANINVVRWKMHVKLESAKWFHPYRANAWVQYLPFPVLSSSVAMIRPKFLPASKHWRFLNHSSSVDVSANVKTELNFFFYCRWINGALIATLLTVISNCVETLNRSVNMLKFTFQVFRHNLWGYYEDQPPEI